MSRFILLVTLIFSGLTSAQAQSQSAFSTSQPNGCLVWNPAPQPNEDVFWTGACKDGYGDGKGTIFWSVNRGDRVELSSTQTSLVRGKLEGASKDIFSSGSINYRIFRNGSVSRSITKSEFESQYGLTNNPGSKIIKSVTVHDLDRIARNKGYSVTTKSPDNDTNPYIYFSTSDGAAFSAIGTACRGTGVRNCLGISLGYNRETSLSQAELERKALDFNRNYNFTKIYIGDNSNYVLIHYIILDDGVTQGNLEAIMGEFVGMAANADDHFGQ